MVSEEVGLILQIVANTVSISLSFLLIAYGLYKNILPKELLIALFVCFGEAIYTVAQTYSKIRKLNIYLFGDETAMITNFDCMRLLYGLVILFGKPYTGILGFYFSMEKVLMVQWPFRYRNIKPKQIVWLMAATTVLCILATVAMGISWSERAEFQVNIMCNTEHFPPEFSNGTAGIRLVLDVIGVFLYIPVAFKLSRLGAKMQKSGVSNTDYDSRTRKLCIYAGGLVFAVLVSYVIPDGIRIFFNKYYLQNQILFLNLAAVKPLFNVLFAVSAVFTLRKISPQNGINFQRRRITSVQAQTTTNTLIGR